MTAPVRVLVQAVSERPYKPSPFLVRWSVNGREHARSFRTAKEAQRWRARLEVAAADEARWDLAEGLPAAWVATGPRVHEWLRTYLREQWPAISPHYRRTLAHAYTDALVRLAPTDRRDEVLAWLRGEDDELAPSLARWARGLPALGELDRSRLHSLEEGMRKGVGGAQRSARTASRDLQSVRRALTEAERRGLVAVLDWPPKDARRPRKSDRRRGGSHSAPRHRTTLTVEQARELLAHLRGYWCAMTAVVLYAGLRPGEVLALEGRDVDLKALTIRVRQAWVGAGAEWGEDDEAIAEPKTFTERTVPIAAPLAAVLGELGELPRGPLFRTRGGKPPTLSNWGRALARAATTAGVPPITPYGCRHFAATHFADRLPLGVAARILGHSVETLVRWYVEDTGADAELTGLFDAAV